VKGTSFTGWRGLFLKGTGFSPYASGCKHVRL
jgi:hypothetical protein